ncbi:hypothetical protein ID866_7697 [Astraeus odoratus]|nr:hypothetical protein ID866_7697 [Astraeus odoratus]
MSQSPPTPTSASPPFDSPKADVILRSSDNIDFRVFKFILSLSSTFFEMLFSLPQPPEEISADTETMEGLPVIPVSEDSKTLDAFLRFCYPCNIVADPVLKDCLDLLKLLEAAKKYSFDALEEKICKDIIHPKALEKDSLQCFAVACHARLKNEIAIAAKHTLREPLIPACFENIKFLSPSELPLSATEFNTLDVLQQHWWGLL